MNCKPGDLAITVNMHLPENNGVIVKVLREYFDYEILSGQMHPYIKTLGHSWVVESQGRALNAEFNGLQKIRAVADARLIPIRGDETPEQSTEAMRLLMQTQKETETT